MMPTFRRLLPIFFATLMVLHLLVVAATPARAQFFDDSLDQEDAFVQDDNQYFEDTGTGTLPGEPGQAAGASAGPDYTEGNRYVDESLVPRSTGVPTQTSRRMQLSLGRERTTLPLNVAWGAGTGLLIGGWFALISEGNNRQTQRPIGLGIVSGILLGVMVGTRNVFNPDAPKPAVGDAGPPPKAKKDGPQFSPVVALNKGGSQVGFRMTF